MQNYLTKPDELKRKLEDPSFKHDFLQWSKSHICSGQNKYSRSKSPHQNSKKQLNGLNSKNAHSRSKENISPNNVSVNKNHSLSKKHLNISKGYLENAKPRDDSIQKRRGQCKSQAHFHSLSNLAHNRSLD